MGDYILHPGLVDHVDTPTLWWTLWWRCNICLRITTKKTMLQQSLESRASKRNSLANYLFCKMYQCSELTAHCSTRMHIKDEHLWMHVSYACVHMRAKRILLLYVYLFEDGFGFHPMFRIFSWNHWWYNVDSHARALGNFRFHARPSPLLTRISQYRRELGRGLLQADRLTPSIVTSCHCRKQAKSIKIHLVGRIVFEAWWMLHVIVCKDKQREPSEGGRSCSLIRSCCHFFILPNLPGAWRTSPSSCMVWFQSACRHLALCPGCRALSPQGHLMILMSFVTSREEMDTSTSSDHTITVL